MTVQRVASEVAHTALANPMEGDNLLAWGLAKCGVNMLVPWYLMASWCYYHEDRPILTDERFDALCKELDAAWDQVTHYHKYAIERSALAAGTCLMDAKRFPPRAVADARALAGLAPGCPHDLQTHRAFMDSLVVPRIRRRPA